MTSTPQSSDLSPEYIRTYSAEVLETRVFGAFVSAVEYRKRTEGITQKSLAEAMGKDETGISKLLSRPSNWTLRKISDCAVALDLDFVFALVDRNDRNRAFLDVGMCEHDYFWNKLSHVDPNIDLFISSDDIQNFIVLSIKKGDELKFSRPTTIMNYPYNGGDAIDVVEWEQTSTQTIRGLRL